MPPTSRACYYHCLRVHLHVVTWWAVQSLLCPDEFGFKLENGAPLPIDTDKAPAPLEMLRKNRCSCKSTNHYLHIMYLLQKVGCRAACTANAEDNVRTAALLPPMNANHESVRVAQQGNENECHSSNK